VAPTPRSTRFHACGASHSVCAAPDASYASFAPLRTCSHSFHAPQGVCTASDVPPTRPSRRSSQVSQRPTHRHLLRMRFMRLSAGFLFSVLPSLARYRHALLWIEPVPSVGPTQPYAPSQGWVVLTTAPTLVYGSLRARTQARPRLHTRHSTRAHGQRSVTGATYEPRTRRDTRYTHRGRRGARAPDCLIKSAASRSLAGNQAPRTRQLRAWSADARGARTHPLSKTTGASIARMNVRRTTGQARRPDRQEARTSARPTQEAAAVRNVAPATRGVCSWPTHDLFSLLPHTL
jgi:hypothetical protein